MNQFVPTNISKPLERAKQLAKAQSIADYQLLFSMPGHHTKSAEVLVCDGPAQISGDLLLSTRSGHLSKKNFAMLFCFGDLNIDGDLLIDDYEYWPLLFIQGNLTCNNILKGGMPMIVLGDIKTTYLIGEYNDGPMRVGGKLDCKGYIPRVKDQNGIAGHVIAGGYNGRFFNAAKDNGRTVLSQTFKAEALDKGWLDSSKVRAMGKSGENIWLTADEARQVQAGAAPVTVPQKLDLTNTSVDPTSLGKLVSIDEIKTRMHELIEEKIEFNPDKNSYPQSFADTVRYQFESNKKGKILVLETNSALAGPLILDWKEPWVKRNNVIAICCLGDLKIDGDIVNRTLEGGPLLFVAGSLTVDNLVKAGAPVTVLGNIDATGIVIGEYNDGTMRVGGNLTAHAYLLFDHDGFVRGEISAISYSDDEGDWRDFLSPAVFPSEDEDYPDVDLIYAAHKAKMNLFIEQ